jgi:hypothetical protein
VFPTFPFEQRFGLASLSEFRVASGYPFFTVEPLSAEGSKRFSSTAKVLESRARSRPYSISAVILPLTSFNVIVPTLVSLT